MRAQPGTLQARGLIAYRRGCGYAPSGLLGMLIVVLLGLGLLGLL